VWWCAASVRWGAVADGGGAGGQVCGAGVWGCCVLVNFSSPSPTAMLLLCMPVRKMAARMNWVQYWHGGSTHTAAEQCFAPNMSLKLLGYIREGWAICQWVYVHACCYPNVMAVHK
jgi:hypothetical protein